MLGKLSRHLASRAKEHHRQCLKAFLAFGLGHILPPFVAGKILATELELGEVILQHEP